MMKSQWKFALALLAVLLLTLNASANTFIVKCGSKGTTGAFTTIGAAVARIAQRAQHEALGPNTILVSGACVENVSIVSLDNVTLQANGTGASISDASGGALDTIVVDDSGRFALNGFTINGSVNCADNAVCRLYGNTIQNSVVGYSLRASRAHIDSQSDSITNNPSSGVFSVNQARVLLIDDTISNNGGHGIQVALDGFVLVTGSNSMTTVSNNAGFGIRALSHGTVRLQLANVTGNALDGIRIQDGSVLRSDFAAPSLNTVSGNGWAGINVGDLSDAWLANDGSIVVFGNLGGTDVYCAGQFAATRNSAAVGGTTNCTEPNPESPSGKEKEKETERRTVN